MAKAKPKKAPSIRDEYPDHPINHDQKPVSQRGGCKVRWETYATEAEAKIVQKWAIVEAEIKRRQGYDSGYCSPGSIRKVENGFEVCIL